MTMKIASIALAIGLAFGISGAAMAGNFQDKINNQDRKVDHREAKLAEPGISLDKAAKLAKEIAKREAKIAKKLAKCPTCTSTNVP